VGDGRRELLRGRPSRADRDNGRRRHARVTLHAHHRRNRDRRGTTQLDRHRAAERRSLQPRGFPNPRTARRRRSPDRVAAGEHDQHARHQRDQPRVDPGGCSACTKRARVEMHRAHDTGQGIGLALVGPTHASTRAGGLLRRIRKLVYLPICPAFVTRISNSTPARSERSNRPNPSSTPPAPPWLLLAATTRLSDLLGQ
jgi:hypothetical protein